MAGTNQLSLLDEPSAALPEGLEYCSGLVMPEEEAELIARFQVLDFQFFEFHGSFGNRRCVAFRSHYDFAERQVRQAQDVPDFLLPLRDRAAALPVSTRALEHARHRIQPRRRDWLAPRPTGIRRRDRVSLAAPCRFRLRRKQGRRGSAPRWRRVSYLPRGPVRRDWKQHPPVAHFSVVTFRSVKAPAASAGR
jgi:hypothetical protein